MLRRAYGRSPAVTRRRAISTRAGRSRVLHVPPSLIDARKRQETMEPIIPDIFARAIVSDGIRADVLIGDDDDAADASP